MVVTPAFLLYWASLNVGVPSRRGPRLSELFRVPDRRCHGAGSER